MTINGVVVGITTFAGDTGADIALWLADIANADSALMALGVGASPLGSRFITNGDITSATINDPGILLPEPDPFLQLIAGAALLWVLAVRRESFSKPARSACWGTRSGKRVRARRAWS